MKAGIDGIQEVNKPFQRTLENCKFVFRGRQFTRRQTLPHTTPNSFPAFEEATDEATVAVMSQEVILVPAISLDVHVESEQFTIDSKTI